jgi:CxxC motif-containing protein
MEEKHFTCIVCPIGCEIDVKLDNGKVISVSGNKCPRGKEFVLQEIKNPLRVLTTTVRIENGEYAMLPVRTDRPVPKSKIFDIMKEISLIRAKAPVKIYDVIAKDICRTGANVIATRSMRRKEK